MDGLPTSIMGSLTRRIYTLIRHRDYSQAINVLCDVLQACPNSKSLLSLLAHCQYATYDFPAAAQTYEHLMRLCPQNSDYRLYFAQSLYQSDGDAEEAMRVLETVENENDSCVQLKLAIAYDLADLHSFEMLINGCSQQQRHQLFNQGCLLYMEGKLEEAGRVFSNAMEEYGFQPDLAYNCALCCYEQHEMGPALQYIAQITDHSAAGHLSEGSVLNRTRLAESMLVEALNLKIAIELSLRNCDAGAETLQAIPSRKDGDIDAVTLYHSALIQWRDDPSDAVHKLEHLLSNPPYPSQTIEALLQLYCRQEVALRDRAMTLLEEERADLAEVPLDPDMRAYIQAIAQNDLTTDDCVAKLQSLLDQLSAAIRRADADSDGDVSCRQELKHTYLIALMAAGYRLYEQGRYRCAERLLQDAAETCRDEEIWSINLGHLLFVQGNRYNEAAAYYANVAENTHRLLDVTPVVLANLCVSYIMTNQTEKAEEVMRRVDTEERLASESSPLHLCIINLVIGTLYCSKGNFDFGLSRVVKSFEPMESKLDPDTWHYAKRCLLSLLQNLAQHTAILSDARLKQVLNFLSLVQIHGNDREVVHATLTERTIAREAELIRNTLLDTINTTCVTKM